MLCRLENLIPDLSWRGGNGFSNDCNSPFNSLGSDLYQYDTGVSVSVVVCAPSTPSAITLARVIAVAFRTDPIQHDPTPSPTIIPTVAHSIRLTPLSW